MKRILVGLLLLVVVAVGIGAAYFFEKRSAAADVRGSSTEEFVVTDEPAEEPPPPPAKPGKSAKLEIVWPTFGFDAERQRVASFGLKPPFRRIWTFRARNLVEFPPAVAYGRLYFSNNSGVVFAVNAKTGKRAW